MEGHVLISDHNRARKANKDDAKDARLSAHRRAKKKGFSSKAGKPGGKTDLGGTCRVGDVGDIWVVSPGRLTHTGC